MRRECSYCGPRLAREPRRSRPSRVPLLHKRRLWIVAAVLVTIVVLSVSLSMVRLQEPESPSRICSLAILSVPLIDQHKDTIMRCDGGAFCNQSGVWPPHPFPPYLPPTDVDGLDGIYGTPDDCPHCSAYCAPASIAMIATYRSVGVPFTNQDDIYDNGKLIGETALGDSILSTHAVGMYDGTGAWPMEVQTAFIWSIGLYAQHDWSSGTQLTAAQMELYIQLGHPILWLDHNGWPSNISYPSETYRTDQGHAKVIVGYDNNDTADTADDLVLVNDPWPEYNHRLILPMHATLGPGGTYDPYWYPLTMVNLNDPADIYLVDTYADIPEFSSIVIPTLTVLAAVVVIAWRKGSRIDSG